MASKKMLGLLSFTIVLLSALNTHAEAASNFPNLHSFILGFHTANDDLRTNSEVIVWLKTHSGYVQLQKIYGGFGRNSDIARNVTFRDPDARVSSCDVTGVKIQMISNRVGNENHDAWNLNSFTMHGYAETGGLAYQLSAGGSPLKRFTNQSPWWEKLQ